MRRLRTTFLRAATLRYDRAMLITTRSSAYSSDVETTESISSTACQETDEFVSDIRRRLSTAFSRETNIIRLQTEYFGKAFHFRFLSGERTLELLLPPYAANGENIPAAGQRTSCDRVSLIPGQAEGSTGSRRGPAVVPGDVRDPAGERSAGDSRTLRRRRVASRPHRRRTVRSQRLRGTAQSPIAHSLISVRPVISTSTGPIFTKFAGLAEPWL